MFSRILEKNLKQWELKHKALIVIGARQVGKTTMLQSMMPKLGDAIWLNADEKATRERLTDPSIGTIENIIGAYKIVIIDEIQRVAQLRLATKINGGQFSGRYSSLQRVLRLSKFLTLFLSRSLAVISPSIFIRFRLQSFIQKNLHLKLRRSFHFI